MNIIWMRLLLAAIAGVFIAIYAVSTKRSIARRKAKIEANGGQRLSWNRTQTGLVILVVVGLGLLILLPH
jgi:hypothetical protein